MPSIIAGQVPSVYWLVAVWVFGGLIALIGALCFAELTTTYPDRGGDYGYLKRGYHRHFGFAFSWAAFWVIRPTSIALMAMIFGEFALSVMPNSLPTYAIAILGVILLSMTNLLGVHFGKSAQNVLTVAKVIGILMVVLAAFAFWPSSSPQPPSGNLANVASQKASSEQAEQDSDVKTESAVEESSAKDKAVAPAEEESPWEWFWLSMVFVMFTFGGWNDIAFVATETREPKKNLLRALVIGTGVVLMVYLLFNFALVFRRKVCQSKRRGPAV